MFFFRLLTRMQYAKTMKLNRSPAASAYFSLRMKRYCKMNVAPHTGNRPITVDEFEKALLSKLHGIVGGRPGIDQPTLGIDELDLDAAGAAGSDPRT